MATYTINIQEALTDTFSFSVQNAVGLKGFRMSFNQPSIQYEIIWGDGNITTGTTSSDVAFSNFDEENTYATAYTGNVIVNILNNDIGSITRFTSSGNGMSANFDIAILADLVNLEEFNFGSLNLEPLTGNLSSLTNTSLTTFVTRGSGTTITGDVININNVSNMIAFTVRGNNTISGDMSVFNSANSITITGQNTVSGNIGSISNNLVGLFIEGNNTMFGNISDLTPTINNLRILGQNTLTGDIATNGITSTASRTYEIGGLNTISGDITQIPVVPSLDLIINGNNTITGNINNMASYPPKFIINGNNTTSGNINTLVNTQLDQTNVNRQVSIQGLNTLVGDFNGLNIYRSATFRRNDDDVVISGDLSLFNVNDSFSLTCSGGSLRYITPNNWTLASNDFITLIIYIDNAIEAFPDTELDQLLIDLDSYNFNKGPSKLQLEGGFTRTSNSDTAVSNLISAGMDIDIT